MGAKSYGYRVGATQFLVVSRSLQVRFYMDLKARMTHDTNFYLIVRLAAIV